MAGCGAVGSALPWGGRGRGFKSRHSDHNRISIDTMQKMHSLGGCIFSCLGAKSNDYNVKCTHFSFAIKKDLRQPFSVIIGLISYILISVPSLKRNTILPSWKTVSVSISAVQIFSSKVSRIESVFFSTRRISCIFAILPLNHNQHCKRV